MRHEDDLRSALRTLEREAPDAEALLRRVTERTAGRRAGRRLTTAVASAAAVIAIILAAALAVPAWLGSHRQVTGPKGPDPLSSAPPYYMALVWTGMRVSSPEDAVVRSTRTGRTLATIRPPAPYFSFIEVTGADDDRTFVLTAQTTQYGNLTSVDGFYEARFSPADAKVSLTPLALPDLPLSANFAGAALSPDGSELAVSSQTDAAEIAIYSLPGGSVRTWTTGPKNTNPEFGSGSMTWSQTGLAFALNGGVPGYFSGDYLLSTSGPGGSLLADSRLLICNSTSENFFFNRDLFAYVTRDGSRIIVPVLRTVPPGQSPPPCSQTVPVLSGRLKLEEFSTATGKAIGVIYMSASVDRFFQTAETGYDVRWSSDSGSVLVIEAPLAARQATQQSIYGVLSGRTITTIPGSAQALLLTF